MTAEQTTAIVIGSVFSALAVAAALTRQGIEAIIVDGSCALKQPTPRPPRNARA